MYLIVLLFLIYWLNGTCDKSFAKNNLHSGDVINKSLWTDLKSCEGMEILMTHCASSLKCPCVGDVLTQVVDLQLTKKLHNLGGYYLSLISTWFDISTVVPCSVTLAHWQPASCCQPDRHTSPDAASKTKEHFWYFLWPLSPFVNNTKMIIHLKTSWHCFRLQKGMIKWDFR